MLRPARREDPVHFNALADNPGIPVPLKEEVGHWAVFCSDHCGFVHQFAESLGNTVDARDRATYNHSREVAEVA
jgi:hypothetical protein